MAIIVRDNITGKVLGKYKSIEEAEQKHGKTSDVTDKDMLRWFGKSTTDGDIVVTNKGEVYIDRNSNTQTPPSKGTELKANYTYGPIRDFNPDGTLRSPLAKALGGYDMYTGNPEYYHGDFTKDFMGFISKLADPTSYARLAYDAAFDRENMAQNYIDGIGLVSRDFYNEHPYISEAINLGAGLAIPTVGGRLGRILSRNAVNATRAAANVFSRGLAQGNRAASEYLANKANNVLNMVRPAAITPDGRIVSQMTTIVSPRAIQKDLQTAEAIGGGVAGGYIFPQLADALYNVSEPKQLELDFGDTVDTSSESTTAVSSPTPNGNNPEDNKNDDNAKEEIEDNKNSGNVKEETKNTNQPKGEKTRNTNPQNEGPNLNDKYKNFKIRDIQRALKNARRDGDVEKVNELSEVLNGISRMKRRWAPVKPWAIGIGGAGGAYGIYQAIKALSKDNKKEEKNKYWDPNIAEADQTGINQLDTILVRSTPAGNDTIQAVFPKNPIDNSPNKEAIIFRDPVTGKLSNDTVRIEDAWKYRDFNMKKISNTANSYSQETFGNDD